VRHLKQTISTGPSAPKRPFPDKESSTPTSSYKKAKVADASYGKNAQKNLHSDYNKVANDVINID
jgi:hypothetical protein